YREYVLDRGESWERLALTKARFVAGDPVLGTTIQNVIDAFVYERPFGKNEIEEMNAIRFRMEHEIGRETDSSWDVKVGRGGSSISSFSSSTGRFSPTSGLRALLSP